MSYLDKEYCNTNIKIYKIWSPKGDKIYIGSTKNPLSTRMAGHRRDYKNKKSGKKTSGPTSSLLFEEYGLENCFIELIIEQYCRTQKDNRALESYYINTMKCVNIKFKK